MNNIQSQLYTRDLQFNYGSLELPELPDHKITILHKPLWHGLVKTIYHLACALFHLITFNPLKAKASLYTTGREFQLAFGWFTFLFAKNYGSQLIQNSRFHQECYSCFFLNSPSTIDFEALFPDSENPHIQLQNKRKWSLIPNATVHQAIVEGRLSTYQFQFISEAQLEILPLRRLSKEQFNRLFPMNNYPALCKEKFAHIPFEEVQETVLHGLNGRPFTDELVLLSDAQVRQLSLSSLTEEQLAVLFVNESEIEEDKRQESQRKFSLFQEANVRTMLLQQPELIAPYLDNLSEAHLAQFPLEELDEEKCKALFSDRKAARAFFAQLENSIIVEAFNNETFPLNCCQLLSDEHIANLPPEKLSLPHYEKIFSYTDQETFEESKRKFALLNSTGVRNAIIANILTIQYLKLLSTEQLQELPLAEMDDNLIDQLFPSDALNFLASKKKFAHIQPEEVSKALLEGKLNALILLSEKHWKAFPLEDLSEQRFNELSFNSLYFNRLPATVVSAAIQNNNLPLSHYKLLSSDQLKALDLTTLNQEQIQALFPREKYNNMKFTAIPTEVIETLAKKGFIPNYLIKCFSQKHLQESQSLSRLYKEAVQKEKKRDKKASATNTVNRWLKKLFG